MSNITDKVVVVTGASRPLPELFIPLRSRETTGPNVDIQTMTESNYFAETQSVHKDHSVAVWKTAGSQ